MDSYQCSYGSTSVDQPVSYPTQYFVQRKFPLVEDVDLFTMWAPRCCGLILCVWMSNYAGVMEGGGGKSFVLCPKQQICSSENYGDSRASD
uniref:Uncharacterized protein n=1 Tax=Magallana gigas TaxID=29159 RepID=K1PS01_MAGGI